MLRLETELLLLQRLWYDGKPVSPGLEEMVFDGVS